MKVALIETSKVWLAFLGAITLSQIYQIAGVVALVTTTAYTIWKWNKESRK